MRKAVDATVIICMLIALYVNLTSVPERSQVVRGSLERIVK
jgi:hypothetical protein